MACHLRLGAAPFEARSRLAYVRLLIARGEHGDEEQSGPMLDSVIDVARRLGMHSLLDEATALRG
jgi:hypothetical protein